MKKKSLLLLAAVALVGMLAVGCGKEEAKEPEKVIPETVEDITAAYKEANPAVTDSIIFTEENDPNEALGRPNQYIGKADLSIEGVEELNEDKAQGLSGGTIETFNNEKDCDARAEYLKAFMDPAMGAFGVDQYTYKYKKMIFRISHSVTPENAAKYKELMDGILEQTGEEIVFE